MRASIIAENQPLAILAPEIDHYPVTLLPICEKGHWKIVILRVKNGKRQAIFLDPFQPKETPEHITAPIKQDLQVEWLNPESFYSKVPKQNNGIDCGPIICIFALIAHQFRLQADRLDIPTPHLLREKLQLAYMNERDTPSSHQTALLDPTPQAKTLTPPPQINPRTCIADLMEKVIKTPPHMKKPEEPEADIGPLINKYVEWFISRVDDYLEAGSPFNLLDWIAKMSALAVAHITRKRPEQLDKLLTLTMPPAQKEGEMATQTEKQKNKRSLAQPMTTLQYIVFQTSVHRETMNPKPKDGKIRQVKKSEYHKKSKKLSKKNHAQPANNTKFDRKRHITK